jgi:hypothetical protein
MGSSASIARLSTSSDRRSSLCAARRSGYVVGREDKGTGMNFSYSAVWDDTMRLIRAHGSVIAALAGVFIFLPALLMAYLLPQPQAETIPRLMELLVEHFRTAWPWILLERLVNMIGTIAILRLVFPRQSSTVAAVIAAAVPLVPTYFVATLLVNLMLGVGLLLFVVPAIYLFGRLAPLGPVIVAEERRNPIDAIRRSFEVTRKRGWAVAGLVIVVGIAGVIVIMVANNLLGILFLTLAGQDLGTLLSLIVTAATAAALTTVMILLYAAIYRRLSEAPADGRASPARVE